MNRRLFIKKMGLLLGTVPAGAAGDAAFAAGATGQPTDDAAQAVVPPPVPRRNETLDNAGRYWRLIAEQFRFPEGYAYLNTGGLGASPYRVTNRVIAMMNREDTFPNAGHDLKDWSRIKTKCAALLGRACKQEEIAFTSTATEGINIVINGLPLQAGDEVITSTHEHVALTIPLLNRMQRDGIQIKTFRPDIQDGLANVRRIEEQITGRTKLIFISHATCTTGQVFPVREIGELARSRGLWYGLDGVQAVAQMPVDVSATGADFYAISGHKWVMGPKRTGVLFVRESLLETLRPTVVGAYSDAANDLEKRELTLQPTAQRYEYATQNDALFYGLEEAMDFVQTIGVAAIQKHNRALAEEFYTRLGEPPGIEILSPAEQQYRSAMITFRVAGRKNGKICSELTKRKFRVRSVGEAGLDGIRVSFHVYNDRNQLERLVSEIEKVIKEV